MTIEVKIGKRTASVHAIRVRHKNPQWGWYWRVLGRMLDNGEVFDMPQSKFEAWIKREDRKASKAP